VRLDVISNPSRNARRVRASNRTTRTTRVTRIVPSVSPLSFPPNVYFRASRRAFSVRRRAISVRRPSSNASRRFLLFAADRRLPMTRLYATGFVSRSDLSSSSSYAPRVFRVVFSGGSFSDEESVSFRFGHVIAARAANAAVSTDKRLRLPETRGADGADGADGAAASRFLFPLRLRGASSRLRTEAVLSFSCAEVATPCVDAGVGAEVATPFSWARRRMRIGVLGEGVGRGDENEIGAFSSAEVKAASARASPAAARRVRRLRAGDGGGAGGGEASPLRLKRGD